jgi:hypothetical protein
MALSIPGFSIAITGDSDPFVRELRRLNEELARSARLAEQQGARMSRSLGGALRLL